MHEVYAQLFWNIGIAFGLIQENVASSKVPEQIEWIPALAAFAQPQSLLY